MSKLPLQPALPVRVELQEEALLHNERLTCDPQVQLHAQYSQCPPKQTIALPLGRQGLFRPEEW